MERIKDKRKGYYKTFPEDWVVVSVGSLLKRIKEPVDVSPSTIYREIGIRSHGKGIFHKDGVLGKTLGNKSVFWVKPNSFVVNIVFAWELAIAKTTNNENGFIASHRFPMYAPLDGKLNLDFLLYYFKTPFGKRLLNLASPGGAGRNKTLGQNEFAKLELCIPQDLEEQTKIAKILSTWDDAIRLQQELIDRKKEQKTGLMQLLLTGAIRVTEMGRLSPEAVKQRVADIRQGIVPEGYRKTKIGIIPNDWAEQKISKCLTVKYGKEQKGVEDSNGKYPILGTGGTIGRTNAYLYDKPSVLIGRKGTIDRPQFMTTPFWTVDTLFYTQIRENITCPKWLYYQFCSIPWKKYNEASGVPSLSASNINSIKIPLPPLSEQHQIADILSTADQELELLEAELEYLRAQKTGLMQLLLTGAVRVNERSYIEERYHAMD